MIKTLIYALLFNINARGRLHLHIVKYPYYRCHTCMSQKINTTSVTPAYRKRSIPHVSMSWSGYQWPWYWTCYHAKLRGLTRSGKSPFTNRTQLNRTLSLKLGVDTTWRSHGMEALSALLALCEGNPRVTGGLSFPIQGSVMRSFDISLLLYCTSCWTNGRPDGDLRRIDVHVTPW